MAQDNQHLTTEQLSAYLDGQASAEEQARLDTHLETCQQCQQELASLQQTVALLHALPQPELPRSFVLPIELAEPVAPLKASTPLTTRRNRSHLTLVHTMLRTVSAIAAILGVVFLLSGLFPTLTQLHVASSTAMNTSSGQAATSHQQSTTSPQVTTPPPHAAGTQPNSTNASTPVPTPTPTPIESQSPQTFNNKSDTPAQDTTSWFALFTTTNGRSWLGIILLILGLSGSLLLRRRRLSS